MKLHFVILRCRMPILATAVALFSMCSTSIADARLDTSMSANVALAAPAASNFELLGQLGGTVGAVYIVDGLAYIGEGSSLTILDIADPQNPLVIGKTAPTDNLIYDVVVVDQVAYVAGAAGLRIIDVSEPTAPTDIGFYAVFGWATSTLSAK